MRVIRLKAFTHVLIVVIFVIIFTPSLLFFLLHRHHHHHPIHHHLQQPLLPQQADGSRVTDSQRLAQVYRGGLVPQANVLASAAANHQPSMNVFSRHQQQHTACAPTRNETDRYFLTILPRGRLGNQMFQFASLLGIADANDRKPVVTPSCKVTHYFKASHVDVVSDVRRAWGGGFGDGGEGCAWRAVQEKSYAAKDAAFDDLPQENLRLKGFLQSWRYFSSPRASRKVREAFRLLDDVQKVVDSFVRNHTSGLGSDVIRVGVHVRRGDMVHRIEQRQGYLPAPLSYLQRAMRYMEELLMRGGNSSGHDNSPFKRRVVFFVVSDDPEWCRDNLVPNTTSANTTDNDNSTIHNHSNLTDSVNTFNQDQSSIAVQALNLDWLKEGHIPRDSRDKKHSIQKPRSQYWDENVHNSIRTPLSKNPRESFHNAIRKPVFENQTNSVSNGNIPARHKSDRLSDTTSNILSDQDNFNHLTPKPSSKIRDENVRESLYYNRVENRYLHKPGSDGNDASRQEDEARNAGDTVRASFRSKSTSGRTDKATSVGDTVRLSLRSRRPSNASNRPGRSVTTGQPSENSVTGSIRIVDKAPSIVHLGFLAACDHVIITVGTFGWWGAYLSGGHVTYYAGYPREDSDLSEGFVKRDFYLPHWVAIGD